MSDYEDEDDDSDSQTKQIVLFFVSAVYENGKGRSVPRTVHGYNGTLKNS